MTLEQLQAVLLEANENVKKLLTDQQKELKDLGVESAQTKRDLLTAQAAVKELTDQITEMEQKRIADSAKLNRLGYAPPEAPKSMGRQFVESDAYKAFAGNSGAVKSDGATVKRETKATLTTGSISGSLTTSLSGTTVIPGIIADPERQVHLRNLFGTPQTTDGLIQYVVETGFTNLAAVVEESGDKPESALSFEVKQETVKTLAHWVPATRQLIDDNAALANHIDTRLTYGLRLKEESQMLYGDGTSDQLRGIKLCTGVQPYAWSSGEVGDNKADAIRRAMTLAEIAEYPVDGIILNPTDWEDIELLKDENGRYIREGVTVEGGVTRLWGKVLVITTAINSGEFCLGAFTLGAELYVREDVVIRISDSHEGNFIKNVLVILGEERVGMVITRPEAFVWGTFDNTPAESGS